MNFYNKHPVKQKSVGQNINTQKYAFICNLQDFSCHNVDFSDNV